MRLQHRHPRSCFSSIITQPLQHHLKHTQFPLSALLSIYIKPSPRPLEPTTSLVSNTIQSARQSRYRHQEDSTPQIFSVSFVHQTPFLLFVFHSSSLYLFFFSKSSVMGRVCFDKMQSSRPRADFLLGWIQLNQPVPDHPSVSIRDRQQSF